MSLFFMGRLEFVLMLMIMIKTDAIYTYTRGVNESLYSSPQIDLTYDGASVILYARLCQYILSNDGTVYWDTTRYCYCTGTDDTTCSYPGPTLLMHNGTTINVTTVNDLTGSSTIYSPSDDEWNFYKDMDTTNLHVHGLHVSPLVDDVLVEILPGHSHSYPYEIDYHYPGTHWYHAHHHGATTWQLNQGLHGMLLMKTEGDSTDNYNENVLIFNWIYAIPSVECMSAGPQSDECAGRKTYWDYSNCDLYCNFPETQRDDSEYVYDLETDLSYNETMMVSTETYDPDMLFFMTNGQISPIIDDMTVGIFRRLRMLNALSSFYIQLSFPDECNAFLIATDGIYLNDDIKNFNLSSDSHQNELFIAPGGRTDVLIKCNTEGIYHVFSSETLLDSDLGEMARIPEGYLMFSLNVTDTTKPTSYFNGTDELPSSYPDKPVGSYVENTMDISNPTDTCLCNAPNLQTIPPYIDEDTDCYFMFELDPSNIGRVNGINFTFSSDGKTYPYISDALTLFGRDDSYEFKIDNSVGHVYHQHINPFQLQSDVGDNGFVGMAGAWHDIIGNYVSTTPSPSGPSILKVRFWTRDYSGLVIVHCHLTEHEDKGMMGFYNILDYVDETNCSQSYMTTTTTTTTMMPTPVNWTSASPTSSPTVITTTGITSTLITTEITSSTAQSSTITTEQADKANTLFYFVPTLCIAFFILDF